MLKIKTVMKQTGLSARTIRYYEQRGLISPYTETVNGRKCREYSEQDVMRLYTAATLRKSLFSIDEISQMLDTPESTAAIFESYKQRLYEQKNELDNLIRCAEQVEQWEDMNAFYLAKQLDYYAQDLPLPTHDVRLNFGRFDEETPQQRAAAYQRFQRWYRFRFVKKLWPILVYAVCFLLTTTIFAVVCKNISVKNVTSDYQWSVENIQSVYGKSGISGDRRSQLIFDIPENAVLVDESLQELFFRGRYICFSEYNYDDYSSHGYYIDLLSVMDPDELKQFWNNDYWNTHLSWSAGNDPDSHVNGVVYGKLEESTIIPSRIVMETGDVLLDGDEGERAIRFERGKFSTGVSDEVIEIWENLQNTQLSAWEEVVRGDSYSGLLSSLLYLDGKPYYLVGKISAIVWKADLNGLKEMIDELWAGYLLVMLAATVAMVVKSTSKNYKMNFAVMRDWSAGPPSASRNGNYYSTQVIVQGNDSDEYLVIGSIGTKSPSYTMKIETGDKTEKKKDEDK